MAATLALAAPAAQALTFTWTDGNFVPGLTAPSPLGAADVLDINAGSNKSFSAVSFSNAGTVNWNADTLYLQSGAAEVNDALWDATSDQALTYNGGASPSFVNNGTFRKSGGAGATTANSGVGFVNHGTLDAQTGSIQFNGGSVFNAGSVFTGAGSVNMAAGSNTFNGAFTSSNLWLSGGSHHGVGAVMGGAVNWTGGNLTGTWSVAAGHTLNGNAGGNKFIAGASLTNQGTMAWHTGESLYLQNGGALHNEALFVANQRVTLSYNGGASTSFENTATGTVRAAAGSTLTVGSGVGFVVNGGTPDAQAGGSIRYVGGSVFNAGTQFTGAGSHVATGNNTWNGPSQSANLVLQSGVHTGGNATLGGNTTFTGGSLSGTWALVAGHTLTAADGGNKFITGAGTVLSNQGSLAWSTADSLYLMSGAAFLNQGTMDFAGDASVLYNGGAVPAFTNTGLIIKSGGAGTSTIGNTLNFYNQGSIDVQSGSLALPANFSNHGTLKGTGSCAVAGTLLNMGTVAPGASPGTLALAGHYRQAAAGSLAVDLQSMLSHDLFNISGTATLDGTLALSCHAACSYAVGDVLTILDSAGDLGGSFASVTLGGFGSGDFDIIYDTVGDRVQLLVAQTVTAVPEPGNWALKAAGLLALGGVLRRRRSA